nr:glycosyltransferase [uncultured Mediterraneibacter sp.]
MKVLIVLNNLRVANGVATVIMNQYDALVENGVTVDFMQFLDFDSPYVDHIKQNGGKIFLIEKDVQGRKYMKRILKYEKYDIVHVNQMNYQTVHLTMIAHYYGVKRVIFHSHNTKIPGGLKRAILEKACNIAYSIFADELIACSNRAGRDSFGKRKFIVLKNAIDVSKFHFDIKIRSSMRKELGISDNTFVVGTVCRYAHQKNPIFMIDIMAEVIKVRPDSKFLWIGSAPVENDPLLLQMEERIRMHGIENKMLWVGSKPDVEKWYSVMDVFMMPSLWEGLGITYIEAQANSLPTFSSTVVPRDTQITPLISYLPLSEPAKKWAEAICSNRVRSNNDISDYYENFVRAGYDLKTARCDLLNIYTDCLK